MSDNVNNIINKISKNIIKSYSLNQKEKREFEIATINYDFESNEGMIITEREHIVNLFTKGNGIDLIKPTLKQIKALAEYIRETEPYYGFWGNKEKTNKVIDSILNENEQGDIIQKIEIVNSNNEKYPYSVRVLNSIDGGNNFYYTGNGKSFKNKNEAEAYKNKLENEKKHGNRKKNKSRER